MFSQVVIARNIAKLGKHGIYLHYHTVKEVDAMIAQIDSAWGAAPDDEDSYIQLRPYTAAESAWINNETLLCRLDFRYWFDHYCFIRTEEDKVIRPSLWKSQEIFLSILADMEEAGVEIACQILKARQLGLSAIISRILLHTVVFFSNRNSFMASCKEDSTNLLFDMADFTLSKLPVWMRPAEKFRREGKFVEFHNGGRITLQHGQQGIGIGRGTTPTAAHVSELAEFDDPSDLIDSSLMRAMHPSAITKIFLEGTARGQNNWWHKTWLDSKAGWEQHRARLRPIFLPWFVGGLYPKPIDLVNRPVPENYRETMAPWAFEHAKMAKEYVRCNPYLSKYLGANWEMPIEQIWYYECERETALRKNKLNTFLQEMPANDDEAFQSTNTSVFPVEVITYYRDKAHTYPLVGCYGLTGPSEYIPSRLQPSTLTVDPNRKPIEIRANWNNRYPIPFTLVPLRFNGWSTESDDGGIDKIYIWEEPIPGEVYGMGVDTADGVGKDRTVIEILRKGSVYAPAKQVGEFASSKMNALDATPFCLALGTWYAVPNGPDNIIKQPRMCIECRGNGDQTQLRLKMHGWTNFHPWVERMLDNKKLEPHKFNKIGVFTNFQFRVGMIDMLVKMIRDLDIEICSPFFVKEMASLEADDFNQSIRADYGGHDDRIMSLGFVIVSLYRFDTTFSTNVRSQQETGGGVLEIADENMRAYHNQLGPRVKPGQVMAVKTYAKWIPGAQEVR